MKRIIKKVAVLGSGIMGSRIACHFANIGVDVLLLDIAPKELGEEEKKKNLSLDSTEVKNRIVNSSLQTALKSNPSAIYIWAKAPLSAKTHPHLLLIVLVFIPSWRCFTW